MSIKSSPLIGLSDYQFRALFSKEYPGERATVTEKKVYALFLAVEKGSLKQIQTLVGNFKTPAKPINACAVFGRARLIVQRLIQNTAHVDFEKKQNFLLEALEQRLKEAKIDRTTFFRNLYKKDGLTFEESQRTSASSAPFSNKGLLFLVCLAGVSIVAAQHGLNATVEGSAVMHISPASYSSPQPT